MKSPGASFAGRKVDLAGQLAYGGLPLNDVQSQSRLPTRRPAVDVFVHLDTYVLSPFGNTTPEQEISGSLHPGRVLDRITLLIHDKTFCLSALILSENSLPKTPGISRAGQ